MAPQRRAPQGAAAQRRELLLDVAAGGVARLARLHEGGTRLEDEGGDPGAPDAEDVRDLLVVEVAQLGEDERGALVVAERVQVVDQGLEVGALLDLGGQTHGDGQGGLDLGERHDVAPRPQEGQAAVARDREQPGPQHDRPLVRPQRAVRGDEGVLERVLGLVGGAEQMPAERQQGPVMAVVQRLEGAVVAGAHARHQSLIR